MLTEQPTELNKPNEPNFEANLTTPAQHGSSVYEFGYQLFKGEFNQVAELSSSHHHFTSLFDSALKLATEDGFLREQTFTNPKGEQLTAPAVPLLSRSGWVHLVEAKGMTNFEFYQFDLARFREADLAGAGDYLLNRAAAVLNKVLVEYGQERTSGSMIPLAGRYGGDEFVIAWPKTTGNAEEAIAKIIKELEQIKAYYQQPSEIINEELLQLKKEKYRDKVWQYEIQPDQLSQQIFQTYFSRGVLLEQVEIDKIKTQFDGKEQQLKQFLQEYAYHPEKIYPQPNLTRAQKITFLTKKRPEFKTAFAIVQLLDQQNPVIEGLTRTQSLLQFIEGAAFDRLLGDIFTSFAVIRDGLLTDSYGQLIALDMKLLKEINGDLSYANGDSAVLALWQSLEAKIRGAREKFDISRRGGTFLLAVKKGETLSNEEITSLKNLKQLFLSLINGEKLSLPVGIADLTVDSKPASAIETRPWLDRQFNVLSSASEDWIYQLLIQEASSQLKPGDWLLKTLRQSGEAMTFSKLIYQYFHGARFKERIDLTLRVLKSYKLDNPMLVETLEHIKATQTREEWLNQTIQRITLSFN